MKHHWMGSLADEFWDNRRKLSFKEHQVFFGDEYPWNMSLAELWSWRGQIAKKLLGRMPTPQEVGMEADDPFFNPHELSYSETRDRNGELKDSGFYRHGRRLKDDSPRIARYRESLSRS